MRLRPVQPGDVDAYVALRCDAAMMAELGGPQRPADMPRKVAKDVAAMGEDRSWTYMIVDDARTGLEEVIGTVTLYPHSAGSEPVSEIGWMVLPAFQGRGVAKDAARQVLARATADGRWGDIHAWPGVTNVASNALCRSLGFEQVGIEEIPFAGKVFITNHWVLASGEQR